MNDTGRRRTTETLQRELDHIAEAATARLLSQMGSSGFPGTGLPSKSGDSSGAHGKAERSESPNEAFHMVREGFVRLGGVLSLSVLVDEPGLLADDLDWLARMMGARSMRLGAPMLALLMSSFIDACSNFMAPDDI